MLASLKTLLRFYLVENRHSLHDLYPGFARSAGQSGLIRTPGPQVLLVHGLLGLMRPIRPVIGFTELEPAV